jgi:hypothetical protein
MPIIWERPDGSLIVERFAESALARERRPDETTAQAVLRLATERLLANPDRADIAGLTPVLVREADMPRGDRLKWRLSAGRVEVNPTVADPVRPVSLEERVAALEAKLA